MTTAISTIINDIRLRYFELRENFELERNNVSQKESIISELNKNNEELKRQLEISNQELFELKRKNEELKMLLEEAENTVPEVITTRNSNIEIDFLVNEIDQCIQQIKTNL
jgi:chromosome segregation ATPase